MSVESVMPSNHLIVCRQLLLPPSILPSIRVFSNESVLHIRWPKYWSTNIYCLFKNILITDTFFLRLLPFVSEISLGNNQAHTS